MERKTKGEKRKTVGLCASRRTLLPRRRDGFHGEVERKTEEKSRRTVSSHDCSEKTEVEWKREGSRKTEM